MNLSLGRGSNWLWLFPAIGAAMLLGAIAVTQQRFRTHALHARGVVVDHRFSRSDSSDSGSGGTYCPIVHFTAADGRQIEFAGGVCSQPRAEHVGDAVAVLYRQDDPHDARIDSFLTRWLAVLVVGGLGGVFLAIGLLAVVPGLRGRRIAADLRATGVAVQADVVEVARDSSIKVNGRSPWRIHAQWRDPASGKIHLFRSDRLWFDPSEYVGERIGVLIRPGRPERYWVDTRTLPELA